MLKFSRNTVKKFWEKEKMMVTSIFVFFFSKTVFKGRLPTEGDRFKMVCIVWLSFNPFPKKPWFARVCNTSLLKTSWEKEKLLVTSNFSFFHSVFYPFGELSAIFIKFEVVVCKLFQFGIV